jgi:hypothetical protein
MNTEKSISRVEEENNRFEVVMRGILAEFGVVDAKQVSRLRRGLITFEEVAAALSIGVDVLVGEVTRRMDGDAAMGDC